MSPPRVVVARELDAAQRAGTFIAASAPGFGEVLAWAGGTEVTRLGLLAQRAPPRTFGITGGRMRGLYVLPAGGAVAWWVRHTDAALPALGLDDGSTFDLSYASEDLHAAIALRDALLGAGLRVYRLDVRTDPNDPEWWLCQGPGNLIAVSSGKLIAASRRSPTHVTGRTAPSCSTDVQPRHVPDPHPMSSSGKVIAEGHAGGPGGRRSRP
jgi:hypothetical protein